MTPPEAKGQGLDAAPDLLSAVSVLAPVAPHKLQVLQQRADFLRAASARRQGSQGFMLQARARHDDSPMVRVGFTCSKKVGNAVARNRAKRRLRELARAVLSQHGLAGWDYVLVGRPGVTGEREFALLLDDLKTALGRIHQTGGPRK